MKPTKTMIRALRETAQKLRYGVFYNWFDTDSCNFGLLACVLLDIDRDSLRHLRRQSSILGSWCLSDSRFVCDGTGFPQSEIIKALYIAGIEGGDLMRIERCYDVDGKSYGIDYKDRQQVAEWMDGEANRLEKLRATLPEGEKL